MQSVLFKKNPLIKDSHYVYQIIPPWGRCLWTLRRGAGQSLPDFSININPLGLSPKGRAALLAHWEKETLRYPDVECRALKKSLSIRYGIPEESMALGNGATELMYKLLELLHRRK